MGRWITQEPLALEPLLQETEDHGSGALVVFYGTVRNTTEGRPVKSMVYEAHVSMAERVLRELEQEVLEQFDVRHCRIVHRIGHLELGEPSVLIVVRSAHRADGYAASRYAIDELKGRAPIWKEEHYADGESQYLDGVPLRKKEQANT
jgi:molybdopterin synthase catalytic subunit